MGRPAQFGAILLCIASYSSVKAQCAPGWTDGFAMPGFTAGAIRCMAQFDEDGPGPKPAYWFMGGDFNISVPGALSCGYLVRYDGTPMSRVRSGSANSNLGVNGPVNALIVFDDDGPGPNPEALFACGPPNVIEGEISLGLAKWDGTKWTRLGSQDFAASAPRTMIVFDDNPNDQQPPALYIGGDKWLWRYDSRGLVLINKNEPLEGTIYALAAYDDLSNGSNRPQLYAGGEFTGKHGIKNIAKWKQSQWHPLGLGLGARVSCLAVFDNDASGPLAPSLFAGGDFQFTGKSGGVAFWNGNSWSNEAAVEGICIGGSCPGAVSAMTVFDADGDGPEHATLVAAGQFRPPNVNTFGLVSKWDGQNWSPLASGNLYFMGSTPIFGALAVGRGSCDSPPELLAAGNFIWVQSFYRSLLLAKWNGQWSHLFNGVSSDGSQFTLKLIAKSSQNGFESMWAQLGEFLCRWNGHAWGPFAYFRGQVAAMCAPNVNDGNTPELFIGGNITSVTPAFNFDPVTVENLTSWDSVNGWQALNPPLSNAQINSLQYWAGDDHSNLPIGLYAVGSNVAHWYDGTAWHQIMPAPGGRPTSLIFDADDAGRVGANLIVGGQFLFADGQETIRNIGRWDGTHWYAMDDGLQGRVEQLTSVEPDCLRPLAGRLIAQGNIGLPGQPTPQSAFCWDGSAWTRIEGFITIRHVGSYDVDGAGPIPPRMFVLGRSLNTIDLDNRLHWWTGEGWEMTDARFGFNQFPNISLAYDDDNDPTTQDALYITTPTFRYDVLRSNGLARFGSPLKIGLVPPQP